MAAALRSAPRFGSGTGSRPRSRLRSPIGRRSIVTPPRLALTRPSARADTRSRFYGYVPSTPLLVTRSPWPRRGRLHAGRGAHRGRHPRGDGRDLVARIRRVRLGELVDQLPRRSHPTAARRVDLLPAKGALREPGRPCRRRPACECLHPPRRELRVLGVHDLRGREMHRHEYRIQHRRADRRHDRTLRRDGSGDEPRRHSSIGSRCLVFPRQLDSDGNDRPVGSGQRGARRRDVRLSSGAGRNHQHPYWRERQTGNARHVPDSPTQRHPHERGWPPRRAEASPF